MAKARCVQVEVHVSTLCNLTCVGCSHWSNEAHAGRMTVQQFRDEVSPWAERLAPRYFLLLGGEPTMNKDLVEIVEECWKTWPSEVKKLLVTNGWYLHRFPDLPRVLKSTNTRLDLSVHHDSPEYLAKFAEIMELVKGWGVPFKVRESFRDWTRYSLGEGKDARPFSDGNPQKSWNVCESRWCLQIHRGKLWKCPPTAYLEHHLAKFDDPESLAAWEQYTHYKPAELSWSDAALEDFVNRRSESCCSMCPANPQSFVKPDPMRRRSLKTVSS